MISNRLVIIGIVFLLVIYIVPSSFVIASHVVTPDGNIADPPAEEPDKDDPPCDDPGNGDPDDDECDTQDSSSVEDSDDNCTSGEPVYLFDGSFYYRHIDLTVAGRIPIIIRRAYDTRSDFKGLMGYGWSMSYHMRLFVLADGNLLLKHGDNTRTEFSPDGPDSYTEIDGYSTIQANGDGTHTLTKSNGYTYMFDIDGCPVSVSDQNNNQLLLTYDSDGGGVKYLVPYSGVSPYALMDTPITLGYDFQLIRIDEARDGVPVGRYVELTYNSDGRIETVQDFTGRQVTYEYDPSGNGDLIGMTDPEGNTYEYGYDENHLITSFVGLGCSDCTLHTNTYNADKKVIQQEHGNGIIQFEYLANNRTKVITQIYNDQTLELINTRYEYYDFDSDGYTTRYTRQLGSQLDEESGGAETDDIVTVYTYDANNKTIQKINPNGVQTDYTYDAVTGNLLTETVNIPGGSDTVTTTYTYDPAHNVYDSITVSSSIESQTYRTEYTYDVNGNIATETTFTRTSDPDTAVTASYTYDEYGNIVAIADPMGNVTVREYDTNGFLTRINDPNDPSHQILYAYDSLGNTLSTTDAKGNTAAYEYDNLGRVTKITDPLGNATINTYSGANVVQIENGETTTEDGRITILEYDSLNRKTVVKMLDDVATEITLFTYTYDSEGRILTTTDGNGNTASNTYDALGRLISLTNPNGFATTYVYDKAGNVIQTTDAELNSTYYNYDYANRLVDVADALGNTTSYTYNALGKTLTVTDAKSNTTAHTYDDAGRLIQVVDPNANTTQYAYDKNSNMIEKITPNEYADPGGIDPIVFTYDQYKQRIQTDYPDGKIATFSYDDTGNMTSWDDGTLSGSTIYDALNRPADVTTNYSTFSKTISYTYNRFAQRDTMTDGEGQMTTYNFNGLGRLTSIDHPGSLTTGYAYDTSGRLIEKTLPNGVVTTYTYDVSNRLTDLVNTAPGDTVISSYAYTHNNVGNRLSMTTLQGTHNYGYDDTYQLTSAIHPSMPAESYTYDAVGNRLTSADHADWTYGEANRLLSYGNVAFTYDNNGNTTSKTDPNGTTTYVYDYENRLVAVHTPEHDISYLYDPFGKRLAKTVDDVTTYFFYDNEDIIAEYDSIGTLVATYYHGQGTDEPVAMYRGGQTYYYTVDGVGSVSELTEMNGNVVEGYIYDTSGNMISLPVIGNAYTYTSREYDVETGFYFYRARYYDAKIGRFNTADPMGFGGGVNFYTYVRNNPTNFVDPYGLHPCDCCPSGRWHSKSVSVGGAVALLVGFSGSISTWRSDCLDSTAYMEGYTICASIGFGLVAGGGPAGGQGLDYGSHNPREGVDWSSGVTASAGDGAAISGSETQSWSGSGGSVGYDVSLGVGVYLGGVYCRSVTTKVKCPDR